MACKRDEMWISPIRFFCSPARLADMGFPAVDKKRAGTEKNWNFYVLHKRRV